MAELRVERQPGKLWFWGRLDGHPPFEGWKEPFTKAEEDKVKQLTAELFDALTQLATTECTDTLALDELTRYGGPLYDELIPRDVAQVMSRAEEGLYLCIQMSPELFWVPWELLWDHDKFFCQRFMVGRELVHNLPTYEAFLRQKQKQRKKEAVVVLGDTHGLQHAQAEKNQVKEALGEVYTCEAPHLPSEISVRETLKNGYEIVHFIGHGQYDPASIGRSGWCCRDGLLRCADIEAITSPSAIFPLLIFADVCESACSPLLSEQLAAALYLAFLTHGVPHYIGTITPVPDERCAMFAKRFYVELAKGAPIGRALWEARRTFFDVAGPPIWAYYVHYGNPDKQLVLRDTSEKALPTWPPPDERVERALREKDLAMIDERLREVSVVAILGEPKIGKTSFAQLLALELEQQGIPILYHDMRLDTTAIMLERFLQQMQVPLGAGIQGNMLAFHRALQTQRYCLVLDNFESALDQQMMVRDRESAEFRGLSQLIDGFLAASAERRLRSIIILTSRCPIYTRGGHSVPEFSLGPVDHQAATRYLQKQYGWQEEEAARIYEIRRGHPMAMHLGSIEIREAKERLGIDFEEGLRLVTSEISKLTFGELYARFTAPEKLVAEIISLHPHGIHWDGVDWIARHLGEDEDCGRAVMRLYQKFAINRSMQRWLYLLPQDQPFVYRQIDNKIPFHRAAMAYYNFRLANLMAQNSPEEMHEKERQYIFYHALLGNELHEAYEILFRTGWSESLNATGRYDTLAHLCRQVQKHAEFADLSTKDRAKLCLVLGVTLRHLGELEEAEKHLVSARGLGERAGEVFLQAVAVSEMGMVARKRDRPAKEELQYYDRAAEVLGDSQDNEALWIRSKILGRKARAFGRHGADPAEIFHYYTQSLELARAARDELLVASRLGLLGTAYRDLARDFKKATALFEEAVALSEKVGGKSDIVTQLAGLAKTHEKAKHLTVAKDLYLRALKETSESDVYGMIDRLGSLGHVHYRLSEFDQAIGYYEKALDLARRIQSRKAQAESLGGLGSVLRTRSHSERESVEKTALLQRALACHTEAVQIQENLEGAFHDLANRYQQLGRTLLALGESERAKDILIKAVHNARRVRGKQHLEAWQFRRLGDAFRRLHQPREAILCYHKAAELFGSADSQERRQAEEQKRRVLAKMDPGMKRRLLSALRSVDKEIEKLLLVEKAAVR